jgi:hypothetical protein
MNAGNLGRHTRARHPRAAEAVPVTVTATATAAPEPPEPPGIIRQQAVILFRRASAMLRQADETEYRRLQAGTLATAEDRLGEREEALAEAKAGESVLLAAARESEDRAKAAADFVAQCEESEHAAITGKAPPGELTAHGARIRDAREVLSREVAAAQAAYATHQAAVTATAGIQKSVTEASDEVTLLRQDLAGDEGCWVPRSLLTFNAAAAPLMGLLLARDLALAEEGFARSVVTLLAERCGLADQLCQEGRDEAEEKFGRQPVIAVRNGRQVIAPPGSVVPSQARPPRS